MIKKNCIQCSKEFETNKKGKSTNITCSIVCRNRYIAYKMRSDKYPLYLVDCIRCGKPVYAKNAQFNKPNRKYCDKACKQRHERTGIAMSEESKKKLSIAKTKHGYSNNKLWKVWSEIVRRCNPLTGNKNYGLRGIAISTEWLKFEKFQEWALLSGYIEGLTIERVDVNGNYCKENCTWIQKSEQAKNRRPSSEWEFKKHLAKN